MTTKSIISVLFLMIFLFSFASAYDSGWEKINLKNGGACGCAYDSCSTGDYGLGIMYTGNCVGSGWDFLAQNSGMVLVSGLGGGRDMGFSETAGNYYLFFKGVYEESSSGNDETAIAGISNNYGNAGRNIVDLGSGTKECVFRNTFYVSSSYDKFWIKGTGGSVHASKFRLATCIPSESGLVYCDDGTPAIANCAPVCTPTTEICGNGIDEDCDGSDAVCPVILAPIVTIHSPINNTTYNTHLITVNATADQTIDTWLYELNGGSVNPLFNGADYTFSQGCHELTVYGENSNGIGTDTVNFCVNLSYNPTPDAPIVTIENPIEDTTYNTTLILINATADQTIQNWTYNIDGGNFSILIPGNIYNFTEGCHDLIVHGTNENGTGIDSVHFCINLGGDDPEDPDNGDDCDEDCNDCDEEEDEDINPYAADDLTLDLILGRDRDAIILGGMNEVDTGKFNIYPILLGLLLLGIIVTLILILLLGTGKQKEVQRGSLY